MVYSLAPKGARLLRALYGIEVPRMPSDVGYGYLAHELGIRDVLV